MYQDEEEGESGKKKKKIMGMEKNGISWFRKVDLEQRIEPHGVYATIYFLFRWQVTENISKFLPSDGWIGKSTNWINEVSLQGQQTWRQKMTQHYKQKKISSNTKNAKRHSRKKNGEK